MSLVVSEAAQQLKGQRFEIYNFFSPLNQPDVWKAIQNINSNVKIF